jgi:hypothetical protein
MAGYTAALPASWTNWLNEQWQLTLDALHSQQRLVLVSAIAILLAPFPFTGKSRNGLGFSDGDGY